MKEFTINVRIGVTEELAALAAAAIGLAQGKQRPETEAPRKEEDGGGAEQEAAAAATGHTEEPAKEEAAETRDGAGTADRQDGGERQEAEAAYSMEDVRAAMHAARTRIEGEGYRENPDSEGYKKYHRMMTAEFLNIAAAFGADKPSALPEDKRGAFIRECGRLEIKAGGKVGVKEEF